jgi:hypothetical protein
LFVRSASARPTGSPRIKFLTWSDQLREFVATHDAQLRAIARPRLIEVRGCEPYAWTYDVPGHKLRWLNAQERRRLALALTKVTPGSDLWILDRVIDEQIDSRILLALFVLFRACLVNHAGSASRAMCRPVAPASRDRGFPLHADLYLHQKLMLAFDDVIDRGGASLFLPVETLIRLLKTGRNACPVSARQRIVSLLQGRHAVDHFDELFRLLHEREHPWVPELEHRMARAQIVLQLGRGEGYLIDDRRWLHGRSPSSIPVTARRFRRLAF